jgi:small subunit ribosomal protein S20
MPNIKSAKERVKINAKKRELNIKVKGAMKTAVKKIVKATDKKDVNLSEATKKIDKALKKGIIKKNTAARKKSLIAKKVNKMK